MKRMEIRNERIRNERLVLKYPKIAKCFIRCFEHDWHFKS